MVTRTVSGEDLGRERGVILLGYRETDAVHSYAVPETQLRRELGSDREAQPSRNHPKIPSLSDCLNQSA